jgi:chemotaxis protein CheC
VRGPLIGLGEPQRCDALAELVNIGMGRAGDSLARLFDTFIHMSIPRLALIEPAQVTAAIAGLVGTAGPVIVVRQAFASRIRGEALAIYTADGCDAFADLVRYPDVSSDELMLEVSNVLVGACVGALAAQFSLALSLSPPSILGRTTIGELFDARPLPWDRALIAEVNFRIVEREFCCHLLTFWPDASIGVLFDAVDAFLAQL